MVNVYFLVNDPPGDGPAPTFAAALEIVPREGEVVAFDGDAAAYKVTFVQHHVRGAMRVEPGLVHPAAPEAVPEGGDEDVPTAAHEVSIMVRALGDDEYDRPLRVNRARAARRLAPFLEDGT